jgi:hypothetical protein
VGQDNEGKEKKEKMNMKKTKMKTMMKKEEEKEVEEKKQNKQTESRKEKGDDKLEKRKRTARKHGKKIKVFPFHYNACTAQKTTTPQKLTSS